MEPPDLCCRHCGHDLVDDNGNCERCHKPATSPVDAPEPDPDEPPDRPPPPPVRTPTSPCEVFWEILEMQIDKFLVGLTSEPKKERDMARASLAARLEAKVLAIRSES